MNAIILYSALQSQTYLWIHGHTSRYKNSFALYTDPPAICLRIGLSFGSEHGTQNLTSLLCLSSRCRAQTLVLFYKLCKLHTNCLHSSKASYACQESKPPHNFSLDKDFDQYDMLTCQIPSAACIIPRQIKNGEEFFGMTGGGCMKGPGLHLRRHRHHHYH